MKYLHRHTTETEYEIYAIVNDSEVRKPDNYKDPQYLAALEAGEVEVIPYTAPEPISKEQRNEQIRQQRAALYRERVDPLILEKISEADPELKAIKDQIRKELPYE